MLETWRLTVRSQNQETVFKMAKMQSWVGGAREMMQQVEAVEGEKTKSVDGQERAIPETY